MSGEHSANAALVALFYEAFARRDAETMVACYAPDARFADPAFGELHGDEVRAMWRMLVERGKDLEVVHSDVRSNGESGSAHWEADYTFSATGRKVHNSVDARFRFADGLIAEHEDSFDLYRWARQALGPIGFLLGWTPAIQRKIRSGARASLDEYMAGGAEADSAG